MRVMVMVKATRESEAGQLPDTERPTAIGRFNEGPVQAGVMFADQGCTPAPPAGACASRAASAR
jgi:hypothetical protein